MKKQDAVFVLYERDRINERDLRKKCKGRQMYDSYRGFQDLRKARQFAQSNMDSEAVLSAACPSKFPEAKPKNPEKPYVVALYFEDKYGNHEESGFYNRVPTHEVLRCDENHLEATLNKCAEEAPNKIIWGIELNLF